MGLMSGSVSFMRYQVLGLSAQPAIKDLNQDFASYQAKRLKLQGATKDLAVGWCKPTIDEGEEKDETEQHWDISDCLQGDGLLLCLQMDRRRVPAKLLQELAKGRLLKLQNKRNRPANARERKQLWAETRDELLALCLPDIQRIDCYWDLERHQILVFSTGKKVQAVFEELFVKTFCQPLSCYLVKVDPPLLGIDVSGLASSKQGIQQLDVLCRQLGDVYPAAAQR